MFGGSDGRISELMGVKLYATSARARRADTEISSDLGGIRLRDMGRRFVERLAAAGLTERRFLMMGSGRK